MYSLPKNIWRTMVWYWHIDKWLLIGYLALIILQIVTSLLTLYFTSQIIGQLTLVVAGDTVSTGHIYTLLLCTTLAILGERIAWKWIAFIDRQSWMRWYVHVSTEFNKAVSRLDMARHHDPKFQKILEKLLREYAYTPQNFANSVMNSTHSLLRLASTLVIIWLFNPWLVLFMTASLLPGFFAEKKYSNLKWNLWGEKGDLPLLAAKTEEFLQKKNKLQETKIFGTNAYLLQRFSRLHQDFYKRQQKYANQAQIFTFFSTTTEVIVSAFIMLWLIGKVLAGSIGLAGYSFYSGAIIQFGSSLGLLVDSVSLIYDKNMFMKDLFWLFDLSPSLKIPDSPQAIDNNSVPTITFSNVSFKYPNSKTWSLENISFSIKQGDKVAFVGENGAGKTTIVRLMLRFYDPQKGQILINGIDIRELDLESYYNHIGVLFQEFNDYPFSVRDNIALGRVENFSDDAGVRSAARLANAEGFINKYPDKYNQVLEVAFEKGIEPSGGQWQRIALARAMFRDAGILILDEPTAAVDAKSEYEIFKTLETHSQDKTTIIISHRFSTIRQAKIIYVIQNGVIIEQGSHSQLLKTKDGLYRDMFYKQAEGYS